MARDTWIFGYGSLVWRPAFVHTERAPGCVRGFSRRFWQASPDHRGTPEAPGRVVTLIEDPDAICWGVGYRVAPATAEAVFGTLDHRERAGYRRLRAPLELRGRETVDALLYVAGPDNPNYTGDRPLADIAAVVRRARGPSGANSEYVLRLAASLAELEVVDEHVSALAALVESG